MRKTIMMFVGHGLMRWASKLEHELAIEEAKIELKRTRIGIVAALGQKLMAMSMPEVIYPGPKPDSEARTH